MSAGTAVPAPPKRRRSAVLFAVGIVLLGLAIWSAVRAPQSGGGLADAWASARNAPAVLLGAALVLPLLNWLLTTAVFWVLTRRYGEVGAGEMAALIGAAWLMNYIPMRPGLLGRVAYHKAVNRIAITDSVRVLAMSIGAGAVATLAILACGLMVGPATPALNVAGFLGAPAFGFAAIAIFMGQRHAGGWRLGTAVMFRYLDVLVWVARYAVVFEVIGRPIELSQAAALAGVSQLVSLVPLAGNGLGLREWAIGWAAASLPPWYAAGPATAGVTIGVTADLVNRAVEVLGAVAAGTVCMAFVTRRLARQAGTSSTTA